MSHILWGAVVVCCYKFNRIIFFPKFHIRALTSHFRTIYLNIDYKSKHKVNIAIVCVWLIHSSSLGHGSMLIRYGTRIPCWYQFYRFYHAARIFSQKDAFVSKYECVHFGLRNLNWKCIFKTDWFVFPQFEFYIASPGYFSWKLEVATKSSVVTVLLHVFSGAVMRQEWYLSTHNAYHVIKVFGWISS